jgi:hypothetical protein
LHLQQFQKEKANLEKELRNAQGVISRSKELRVLQYTLEEVSKLRNELDLMGDQKMQVLSR